MRPEQMSVGITIQLALLAFFLLSEMAVLHASVKCLQSRNRAATLKNSFHHTALVRKFLSSNGSDHIIGPHCPRTSGQSSTADSHMTEHRC